MTVKVVLLAVGLAWLAGLALPELKAPLCRALRGSMVRDPETGLWLCIVRVGKVRLWL